MKALERVVYRASFDEHREPLTAGLFAPVFRMPKPTGPYRVGKRTTLWTDRSRRSWLLKNKPRLGQLPEHRKLMANVWYPAAAAARLSLDEVGLCRLNQVDP
jgi:hypothetical protein